MKEDNNQGISEKNSIKIKCREYEKADLAYVKSLMHELGYSVSTEALCSNIKEIQKRAGVVFVAELNNQLVGCICSVIDVRLAEGVYGEIVSLIVSAKFRGAGVGKSLVETSENWLCRRVAKVRVRANEVRIDAHSFYRKLGYEKVKNQTVLIKKL
jgi:GNAT superfamily N-acetyltransferase